ncbi:ComEA family DNA-binding protein [Patescibacteria group bacterium]|nr:ComEA family DNA-binding protein [Patescibacteria group bacterium]
MESRFDLAQFFEEHRTSFLLGLVGLFLLGVGVLSAVVVGLNQSKPAVEIIPAEEAELSQVEEIVVDVAGAVEKPGVYRLSAGSRINDALVAAGGLSADADRVKVERYINLAQKLNDGIKIYIPSVGEQEAVGAVSSAYSGVEGSVIGTSTQGKVDINTASAQDLDALWGIGEKRAAAIIENRPYGDIREIETRAGIPRNVFERIKDKISVY